MDRNPKQQKQRPISQEEIRRAERRRARLEYERRMRIEQQKRRREAILRAKRATALTVIGVLCVVLIAAAFVIADIALRGDISKDSFTYYLGDNKKVTLAYDRVVFDGEKYLNFSDIAEEFGFTVTGDGECLKFIARDDYSEYAQFGTDARSVLINGERINLYAPVRRFGEDVLVPMSFISDYMDGLCLEFDKDKHQIKLCAVEGEQPGFKIKSAEPLDPIDEEDSTGSISLGFKSDLSAYEQYMNPEDRDAYCFLVNAENPLSADYVPGDLCDLVDTRDDGRNVQQMTLYAAKALEAFLKEARANGFFDISVTSGYRSYSYQDYLFSEYVRQEMAADASLSEEEARAIVATYSALPGTSEHQSGLCVDMHNMASAQTAFGKTEAAKWLAENAYKFGFILRYPEDKTEQTGIVYEPWHFRYVGRYHATNIKRLGLCLEEYTAMMK